MQPSGEYENTFKFVDNPLNGIKNTTILEVHTTHTLFCNGVLYLPNTNFKSPLNTKCYVNNVRKEGLRVSKKMYNINTNNYNNLITNKDVKVIDLYDKLEEYILSLDKKIIRNYIHKGIVFKYKRRIAEVLIKQQVLTIVFLRTAKEYDNKNLLYLRKGYEKDSICYSFDINDNNDLKYACNIFKKTFESLTDQSEINYVNDILEELTLRIKKIHYTIKRVKKVRGVVFKGNRNFCILERRKYGIQVRLLPVPDDNNVLKDLNRKHYEPLCKYYNINKIEEIDTIIPYLSKAFEMTKYPAIDVKNRIISYI